MPDISQQFLGREKAPRIEDDPFVVNLVLKYGDDHPLVQHARKYKPWQKESQAPKAPVASAEEGPPPAKEPDHERAGLLEPYRRMGALIMQSSQESMASFSDSLDEMSQFISSTTGLPKGGVFEGARNEFLKSAEYWDSKVQNEGLTEQIIADFIGGAAPGIAEFILGVPYAGLKGFSRDYNESGGSVWAGLRGATREAIHRHIMGKILHASNQLGLLARSIAMGTTGAVATPGGARERARGAGVMTMLGITAGPGPARPYEAMRRSASARETGEPLKSESTTEAPGTQAPSRQVSQTKPVPGAEEIRTSSPSTSAKRGFGKDLGDASIGESIDQPKPYVKPGRAVQMTTDADALLKNAKELKDPVHKDVEEAARALNIPDYTIESRVKDKAVVDGKLRRKQASEPGYGPEHIKDYLGTRLIDSPLEHHEAVKSSLTEKGYCPVGEAENFYEAPRGDGYRGVHQEFRAPDGHIFELQFHTPYEREVLDHSHRIYEKWRDAETAHGGIPPELQADYEADLAQSRAMWQEASEKYEATKTKGPTQKVPKLANVGGKPGATTTVRHLEGEDTVQYRIVDLDDLQPSHLPGRGFAKNPNYPEGVQPRPYHSDKTLQAQVLSRSNPGIFHPPFLISDNPDAINGPPIVTKNGLVMGGNSRVMLLDEIYRNKPEAAQEYRDYLQERMDLFGIEAIDLEQTKNPVLVRVLEQGPADMARTAKNYNEPFTMGQELGAEAVSRARLVSSSSIRGLAQGLEDAETLRAYLATPGSKKTINALIKDGAIEETRLNQFINKKTGLLTEDGKRLVEGMLRGKVIDDYDLMDAAPASAIQKIDRILPAMVRIQARGGEWDITDTVKTALADYIDFRNTDFRTVEEFLSQGEMFERRASSADPRAFAMLRAFAEWKPLEFKDAFNEYAKAAEVDVADQGTLAFYKPENPTEAYDRIFGARLDKGPGFISRLLQSEAGMVMFQTPEDVQGYGEAVQKARGEPVLKIDEAMKTAANEFLAQDVRPSIEHAPDVKINWRRIETSQDVALAIEKVKGLFPEKTVEAKGYESFEQTEKLANELGMTPEKVIDLQGGAALRSSELLALRMMHLSSARELVDLAKKARGVDASELDIFQFRKQFAIHSAIQEQFFKYRAEAGRALSSWRIMAKESAAMGKEIQGLLEAHGGSQWSKEIAGMMASLETPAQVSTFTRQAQKANTSDMLLEAWINGLLSGPQTHAVNTLSNSLVATWMIPERLVASQIGKVLPGDQEIAAMEAVHQAYGLVQGAKDGFRLAWQTFKTGEPTDPLSKIEARRYRAITAESLELSGTAGRAVDLLGEGIRMPGRFLMAEDEFFKGVGYRMELNAQAYRQARAEGLQGEQMANRIQEIKNDPPDNVRASAMDAARYQTFTRQLEGVSRHVQRAAAECPALRVVVPFVRTPVNIARFGILERTPLGFLSKSIRADINAGGAARDLALARISLGSLVMATVAAMTAEGLVTGGGPTDPGTRRLWLKNHQPYSIKIGNKWRSYGRLEPLGTLLGLGADSAEIIGQIGEAEADNLATAVVMSMSKNVTSKTYMRGMTELIEVTSDPDRYGERYIQRLAGTVIPTGVVQLKRTKDPTLRQVGSILEEIQSRTPGWSEDLPPRRDLFGEPIVLEGGLGPDIVSPIYQKTIKPDPVYDEMWDQKVFVGMPAKQINGVELTPREYDRYVVLAGNEAKDPATGMGLKESLKALLSDPNYQRQSDGPDGGKNLMIRSHIQAFRELARQQVISEFPELHAAIFEEQQARQEALRPQY